MGTLHDITEALGIRRRRRVRYVEPAAPLETWFQCARHHDGCRELVRAPGFCRACMTALSVARNADVRAMVRAKRGEL